MRRLLLLSMFLAGCHLYTGGGDDDTPPPDAGCEYNEGAGVADLIVHDSYSGECESEYTSPPCDPSCGCYPTGVANPDGVDAGVAPTGGGGGAVDGGVANGVAIPAEQYSGECYGPCSELGEGDCLANPACHATYEEYEDPTGLVGSSAFWSCWDITPNTPEYSDLPCSELDPWTCSVSPSCASMFEYDEYGDTYFDACIDKSIGSGSACDGVMCPDGETCQESCAADGSCIVGCVAQDPGDCTGDVTCDMAPPACPTGTYAGILDGCYTGYCIPASACGPLPCSTLTTESACTARPDCDAVYVGSDCTCDDTGCTCSSEVFEDCVTGGGSTGGGSAMPL